MRTNDGMTHYKLKGTWRELGAIGAHEAFERDCYGFSPEEVVAYFRECLGRTHQDILITRVEEA